MSHPSGTWNRDPWQSPIQDLAPIQMDWTDGSTVHSFWTVETCQPLIKLLGSSFEPPPPYIGGPHYYLKLWVASVYLFIYMSFALVHLPLTVLRCEVAWWSPPGAPLIMGPGWKDPFWKVPDIRFWLNRISLTPWSMLHKFNDFILKKIDPQSNSLICLHHKMVRGSLMEPTWGPYDHGIRGGQTQRSQISNFGSITFL